MEQLRASPVEIRRKLQAGEVLTADEYGAAQALALWVPLHLRPQEAVDALARGPEEPGGPGDVREEPVERPAVTGLEKAAEDRLLRQVDERVEALGQAAPPEQRGEFGPDAPAKELPPPDADPLDEDRELFSPARVMKRLAELEQWAAQFHVDVTRATNAAGLIKPAHVREAERQQLVELAAERERAERIAQEPS